MLRCATAPLRRAPLRGVEERQPNRKRPRHETETMGNSPRQIPNLTPTAAINHTLASSPLATLCVYLEFPMPSEESNHEKDARDWSHSSGSSSAVRSAY